MAFDATVGGASATSYLTVAEADALAQQDIGSDTDAWLRATVETKERALMRATRECSALLAERAVTGMPLTTTQALPFPRYADTDGTGTPVIIDNLRWATYEQAVYLVVNHKLLEQASKRQARGMQSFQDDDGSGSLFIEDPQFGRLSRDAVAYLRSIDAYSASIHSVPIGRP